jgi:hypothetical protein
MKKIRKFVLTGLLFSKQLFFLFSKVHKKTNPENKYCVVICMHTFYHLLQIVIINDFTNNR